MPPFDSHSCSHNAHRGAAVGRRPPDITKGVDSALTTIRSAGAAPSPAASALASSLHGDV